MSLSYAIIFKVGGKTGNKVTEVRSNIHTINVVICINPPAITEPSDKRNYIQYATTNNNEFIVPDFEGG